MNRKAVSGIMLMLLLMGMLTLAFNIQPVKASGTIYIRTDGSIEGTDKIRRDGSIYTFTDDLYVSGVLGGVVVQKDNIVIDGGGHSISGSPEDYPLVGIDLSNGNNITIRNTTIKAFTFGIYLSDSSSISIFGNNITENAQDGITALYSSDIIISGNNITNNDYTALTFNLSSNITISANNIINNGLVFLATCSNSTISRNNVANNSFGISLWDSSNNTVSGNKIMNNNYVGLTLSGDKGSLDNSIYGNNITHNYVGVSIPFSPEKTLSYNNKFYQNNFVDNSLQVYTQTSDYANFWDDDHEGNYWSDYTGVDSDHDGIGDTAYIIDANNIDNSPLMGMFSSFNTPLRYYVNVISNSTIRDFEYSKSNSTIRMYVSNMTTTQTHGFGRVRIPHVLMYEPYNVTIDGANPVYWNYTLYDDGAHRWIYFSYQHSTHKVVIQGSDTAPPIISILYPENKTYPVNDIPLTFTVDEPTDWMGYSLDRQTNVTIAGNITITSLPDGPHYVVVYANDIAGNMGASSTIYFTIDTTAPAITIVSPENKTYASTSVPLNFTISESTSWIGYSLNGQANVTITGNTTLTSLVRGVYSIVVYASDMAGNTGHSNKIFFEVVPYIAIDQYHVSDEGADIGSVQTVGFHAKWDNSSDVVGGSIYVNRTEYITNSTGWISFNVSSSTFGKEKWVVTGVNCSGVTTYIQTASNPSIFWGRNIVLDWQQFLYWDGYGLPSGSKFFFEPEHEWWQIRWHYIPSNNESYYLGFEVYIYKEAVDIYLYYTVFGTEGRTEGQYRFDELGRFMVIVHLENIEYVEIYGEHVDDAPPITSHDYDGTWHTSDLTVRLTAVDQMWGYLNRGSGILDTYYRVNDKPWQSISADDQPLITSEGTNNTLEYWSVDKAGNEELHKILTGIKLDKTAPRIGTPFHTPWSDIQPDQEVKVSVNATDFLSGLKDVNLSYNLNDATWIDLQMFLNSTTGLYEAIIPGQQANIVVKYRVTAYDDAGNHKVEDNNGQYYAYAVMPPEDTPPPQQPWPFVIPLEWLIIVFIVIAAIAATTGFVLYRKRKA